MIVIMRSYFKWLRENFDEVLGLYNTDTVGEFSRYASGAIALDLILSRPLAALYRSLPSGLYPHPITPPGDQAVICSIRASSVPGLSPTRWQALLPMIKQLLMGPS